MANNQDGVGAGGGARLGPVHGGARGGVGLADADDYRGHHRVDLDEPDEDGCHHLHLRQRGDERARIVVHTYDPEGREVGEATEVTEAWGEEQAPEHERKGRRVEKFMGW